MCENLPVRCHHPQQQSAYIDPAKCKLCRKCEEACPKGAIHAINFPPRKPKAEKPAVAAAPAQKAAPAVAEEKKEA